MSYINVGPEYLGELCGIKAMDCAKRITIQAEASLGG